MVVLLIVATSSGSGTSSSGPAASPRGNQSATSHSSKRKTTAHSSTGSEPAATTVDTRGIDRVLAYTPFIKGGIPRHRVIALTFDDGPSPYTDQIVRILSRMHATATFFIVGQQLNDFAARLRDELRQGFAVGDHTENHAYLTRLSTTGQYKQLHDAAVRLARLGAPFPRLFRPPYGAYNSGTLAVTKRLKMLMTLWSVDTRDWTRPGTAMIVSRAVAAARPGAVVLMHDGGGNRSETVAALPAIINALRRRHYDLVTVPQLLRLDPPPRGQQLPHVSE